MFLSEKTEEPSVKEMSRVVCLRTCTASIWQDGKKADEQSDSSCPLIARRVTLGKVLN